MWLCLKSLCLLTVASILPVSTSAFGVRPARRPASGFFSMAVAKNDFASEQEHTANQAQAFDDIACIFSNHAVLPPEVKAVYKDVSSRFLKEIMSHRKSNEGEALKILDVGCGAGVLFEFLLEAANGLDLTLHVTGVDLSEQLVQNGRAHAQSVLGQESASHTINVYVDEACRFLNQRPDEFDGVIANSCFSNFWDQSGCIEAMTRGLRDGGVLCVSHPVGSGCVEGLNRVNPNLNPHLMPNEDEFKQMTSPFPVVVLDFDEKIEFAGATFPMYYASAAKVPPS